MAEAPELDDSTAGTQDSETNGLVSGDAPAASSSAGDQQKKRRGKPKDLNAPPKPKNAFQQVTTAARARLREERPELVADLKAMGLALKAEWEAVPQEEKDRLSAGYEKEMEIWRPKWAVYKKTEEYKEFFEKKQDWLDHRDRKKLFKAHAKVAPKKPKSGYMIFASEVREQVVKEVAEAGGGMADIGKKIAEAWAALSEAKKAEYGEQSERQKEEFKHKYEEHKKSESFKEFMEKKAKLEGRQKVKKLERTTMKDAPKKPPSAFSLFKAKFLPQVMEENKGAACGELAKKVGLKWAETSEEDKAAFVQEAEALKKQYFVDLKAFKAQKVYSKFLAQRTQLKMRENKAVNLRNMPKKPKNVFALFKEDHKTEAPEGKGQGKGKNWVKKQLLEADDESKKKYEEMEKELKEKYEQEFQQYKEGEEYQNYVKTETKIKRELMNEAMKLMTLKFLSDAPAQPPKSAFAIFLGEKRRAQAEAEGASKAKKAKQDEVSKYKEEWMKLDQQIKTNFEEKHQERMKAWQEEVKEYMAQPKWKEYIQEAKELKVPVKSFLSQKKKAIVKLKKSTKHVMPSKPAEMPSKPPGAKKLFFAEKKAEVEDATKLGEMWEALSADEKAKYETRANELLQKFQEDLKAFETSDVGKKYNQEVKGALRRRRLKDAKAKFLKEMPKKPDSAVTMFFKKSFSEVKKEKTDMKGSEIKKILRERWLAMSDAEKEPHLEEARQAEQEYSEKVASFKQSDSYKAFARVTRIAKPKAKAKAKGGKKMKNSKSSTPQPKKPESMPSRPPDAFKLFMKEQAGGGKSLGEMAKMFREISADDKTCLEAKAKELMLKYTEDMAAFEKTDEGKKYKKEVKIFTRRKGLAEAKTKYLQEEPKKPSSALTFFTDEKREELQSQLSASNSELRGLKLRHAVIQKTAELWKDLTEEAKTPYLEKEKDAIAAYNAAMDEFRKSANYKKYQSTVNRLSGSKPKGKGKGGKKDKKSSFAPPPPENLPKKPASGFMLFMSAQRTNGVSASLTQHTVAWRELGAEGQKKYQDEAAAKLRGYEEEMRKFKASADGKKYFRLQASASKKQKEQQAKERYLRASDAPKEPSRPPSPYQIFLLEKKGTVSGKAADIAKLLTTMWSELPEAEKKVYDDKHTEMKAQYDKDLAAFKSSANYKKYEKTLKSINKKQAPVKKVKEEVKVKSEPGKGKGRGKGATAKAKSADSDSDIMGSDSEDSSSSSDSDSD